jgi:hypothetical protein
MPDHKAEPIPIRGTLLCTGYPINNRVTDKLSGNHRHFVDGPVRLCSRRIGLESDEARWEASPMKRWLSFVAPFALR